MASVNRGVVKSRVRSGCVTYRCANGGFECDGYCYNSLARKPQSNPPLPPGATITNSRVAISRVQSISKLPIIVQPSASPEFKNDIEHRYFVVFQESAAAQLSGYYESSLWDRIIPQACQEEQWAMNLVIAIGALHSASVSNPRQAKGEEERKCHYIFALQQYGKALVQLNSKKRDESESSLRYALISSLLTTCFETYIGNRDNAITQAKVGINILLKWTAKHQKEPADDLSDEWSNTRASRSLYIHDDLLDAFQRLDYQLALVEGIEPGRKSPRAFPSISRSFTSLDEACRFWDLVVRRVLYFHSIKDVRVQHSPQGYDEDKVQKSDTTGIAERHNFTTATEQFFRSFWPIFENSRQRPGTKEYLLANLVMIRSLACRLAVSRGPSYSELYSDAFLQDCKLIIKLAHELIDNLKTTLGKAIFSFEITLGVSVFSLSHLCREPTVRRQAINLLYQYPQREGWFDTLVAAKISTWLMNKEEELIVNGFIPDPARLRLIKHEVGPRKQLAVLRCSKLVWEDRHPVREMIPCVTITL